MKYLRLYVGEQERQDYKDEVIDTLRRTELNPETTLIMGGAALALAGLRRAGDVDLMVPQFVYRDIARQWSLPNGARLQQKTARTATPFLQTIKSKLPPGMMSVDLMYPYSHRIGGGSPELDNEFLAALERYDSIEGFNVLPLELVAADKARGGENGIINRMTRKDRRDIELIEEHLTKK